MSLVDIQKGFRQYSPAQLREYCYQGLLSSGKFEINDFVEYIFSDYDQVVYDKVYESVYQKVCSDLGDWDEEFK